MDEFSMMDETVDKICWSLENEGCKWKDTAHTLDGFGMQIWKGFGPNAFTETWNGDSLDAVFSRDQSVRIYKSYKVFKQNNASLAQQKVIDALSDRCDDDKQ